jgi:uncharacterized phage protein (TIGR01671 family)
MREIKFRAWDKNKKEIRKVTSINWYDEYIWVDETPMSGDRLPIESTPLMQYIKDDKNGVEIYEGDILSYPEEEQIISIFWDDSSAGWEFNEHSGLDDGVGRGDWDFNIGIAKNCEVIGNIYENPELLDNN